MNTHPAHNPVVRPGRLRRTLFRGILPCLAMTLVLSAGADVPKSQTSEVEHLISYLSDSPCEMVRNGKTHSGAEGARHVRRKYDYFRDEIESTEEFIEKAASGSLRSGQPYEVQCPGEARVPSADWLLAELRRYRATQ